MCGGKKEEKKAEGGPLPEPPADAPPPAPEGEAPPPAAEEPPKGAGSAAKSTLSKMSDSKLAAGQQSLNLMTTRGKGGAGLAKGKELICLFILNFYTVPTM